MRQSGLTAGAASPAVSFEVQIWKTDHWILERICTSESEAREFATKILPTREGVRVVREFQRPGGQGALETVIWSEMRQATKKPISVTPIEDAPVCHSATEYYGLEARQTISRLLRQYLEEKGLTASELLHHPGEMKRVMNFEALVPNAVSRVAGLQSKHTGEDVRQRRDDIYSTLDELRVRAERVAARKDLPNPKQNGFTATMQAVENAADGNADEADYMAKVVLCRDLVNVRNLLGKIEWILDLSNGDEIPPQYMRILDGLVSDTLTSPAVVQDLLGRQPDLGAALLRITDVVEGSFEATEREMVPAVTTVLSRWVGSGMAPQTRLVLLEFLQRNLRGTQRLRHGDPVNQREVFKEILARLMTTTGFVGGPKTAEALTLGYFRFIEQGGGEGRRISMEGVCSLLPSSVEKLIYLATLASSDCGQKEMTTLVERAGMLLGSAGGVNGLVAPSVPLKQKMQMLAALYDTLRQSGMPANHRDALADQLDQTIADYIVNYRIIEKLDDPSAMLRVRAIRLVQFAATDVLSSPKARKIVRDQIIGHLRQPNFDGRFVEGLETGEEKARALRTFYDLLNKAQFG